MASQRLLVRIQVPVLWPRMWYSFSKHGKRHRAAKSLPRAGAEIYGIQPGDSTTASA